MSTEPKLSESIRFALAQDPERLTIDVGVYTLEEWIGEAEELESVVHPHTEALAKINPVGKWSNGDDTFCEVCCTTDEWGGLSVRVDTSQRKGDLS